VKCDASDGMKVFEVFSMWRLFHRNRNHYAVRAKKLIFHVMFFAMFSKQAFLKKQNDAILDDFQQHLGRYC
jgi:uncharacterized membrane protein